jgi:serine/threonine protein kinase
METLVMERINGHTIREIIKERLDLPKDFNLVSFFQELKGFMEKIHNNRIYHRDFHEGNIMIDENGRPWIIDFGDACYAFDEEEAYSSSFINPNTRRTETMKYTSDNNNLAAVQISLRKYIFSRQKNI